MLHVYNVHSSSTKISQIEITGKFFGFYCIWKKDGKAIGKNWATFWHDIIYITSSFVLY